MLCIHQYILYIFSTYLFFLCIQKVIQFIIVVQCVLITCVAQDTPNGVQSVDVVLYGLSFVIPLMNNELLKVSAFVHISNDSK